MEKIFNRIFNNVPQSDDETRRRIARTPRHRYERPSILLHKINLQNHQSHGYNRLDSWQMERSDIISDMLRLHNSYRVRHSASPLVISQRLSYIAQKYAEHLAKTGKFEHSRNRLENESLGENLYMQWTADGDVPVSAKDAIENWYDEIKLYSFKHSRYSEETGHFTQMVWKSSKKLGVGIALSANGREVYIVANYYPKGNIINSGYFQDNVSPARH